MAEQDMQEQYKVLAQAAIRRLQQLTTPLNEGLKSLYPRARVDSMSDEMTQKAEGWRLEQPEPGVLRRRTPAGRTYTTTPTAYPV